MSRFVLMSDFYFDVIRVSVYLVYVRCQCISCILSCKISESLIYFWHDRRERHPKYILGTCTRRHLDVSKKVVILKCRDVYDVQGSALCVVHICTICSETLPICSTANTLGCRWLHSVIYRAVLQQARRLQPIAHKTAWMCYWALKPLSSKARQTCARLVDFVKSQTW